MNFSQDKIAEVARSVLSEYDLSSPRLTFIQHSDNITYRVMTANGNSYLLRLHVPVTAAMGTHGANFEMVNSEVTWLLALAQDTHLTLQKPVQNRSGSLITTHPLEDGSKIHCTLLSWVEGQPYQRDSESPETAYQIGELMATLHDHASGWGIPAGFSRPQRDRRHFQDVLAHFYTAVEDERISASDYAVFSISIEKLIDMIDALDESQRYYGIMHADAHKGNMLLHNGKIRLIDFSFCAFGNYMFDVGVCLSDMKPELHRFFFDGYQSIRQLPSNYQDSIEAFFIGSVVGTFSFWVDNPQAQELLARKVPQIAADYATKFNQGERFWFSS